MFDYNSLNPLAISREDGLLLLLPHAISSNSQKNCNFLRTTTLVEQYDVDVNHHFFIRNGAIFGTFVIQSANLGKL